MESDLLPKAAQLSEWVRDCKECKTIVATILSNRGYISIGQLAHENPDLFRELYETIETMIAELPFV